MEFQHLAWYLIYNKCSINVRYLYVLLYTLEKKKVTIPKKTEDLLCSSPPFGLQNTGKTPKAMSCL